MAYILDLRVRDKMGNERVVRTYQNSPVITDEVHILGVGPETAKVWGTIIQEAKGVIVIGDTSGFEDVLSKSIKGQVRVLVNKDDEKTLAILSKPEIWKSAAKGAGRQATIDEAMNRKKDGAMISNIDDIRTLKGIRPNGDLVRHEFYRRGILFRSEPEEKVVNWEIQLIKSRPRGYVLWFRKEISGGNRTYSLTSSVGVGFNRAIAQGIFEKFATMKKNMFALEEMDYLERAKEFALELGGQKVKNKVFIPPDAAMTSEEVKSLCTIPPSDSRRNTVAGFHFSN